MKEKIIIPHEIIEHIVKFCDIIALNKCLLVSRQFSEISSANHLWKPHLETLFHSVIIEDRYNELSFRELYISTLKQRIIRQRKRKKKEQRVLKSDRLNQRKLDQLIAFHFPLKSRKKISGILTMLFFLFLSISMIVLFIQSQLSSTSSFSIYYFFIPFGMAFGTEILLATLWGIYSFDIFIIDLQATLTNLSLLSVIFIGFLPLVSGCLCLFQATGDIDTYWSILLVPFDIFMICGGCLPICLQVSDIHLTYNEGINAAFRLLSLFISGLLWLSPIFIGLHLDVRRRSDGSAIIPIEIGLALILPYTLLITATSTVKAYQTYIAYSGYLRYRMKLKQVIAMICVCMASILTLCSSIAACFISIIGDGIYIISALALVGIGIMLSLDPYFTLR
eukprot:gb/GECH01007715.1/.p1 GENE.gb/GECH01007715.1/~~gb/GECH01007715.1/.p1  ORF type:complete len:393 (+),score=48.73 gb/GECH01007715.1/:1-1179(+)